MCQSWFFTVSSVSAKHKMLKIIFESFPTILFAKTDRIGDNWELCEFILQYQ